MTLSLRHYGDPILVQKSTRIDSFGQHLDDLVSQMVEIMRNHEGIGLAAQQVGLTERVCVIEVHDDPDRPHSNYKLDGKTPPFDLWMPCGLINPEIVSKSPNQVPYEEGCLSFPGIRGQIRRPDAIQVRFQDTRGNPHELSCDGLLARVIQHEVDHLDGVLFIDRMDRRIVVEKATKIKQLKRKTRESLKK